MRKILLTVLSLALTAGGAYFAGRSGIAFDPSALDWSAEKPPVTTQTGTGRIVYYRHPDGEPEYSTKPEMTADGRDFVAVRQSEDVSFDISVNPELKKPESANVDRKVRYYRNPMGLPDTSPVPKKDSMGMDYIPVFEGEEQEVGIVKISPGKLQRTGVKSAQAKLLTVSREIRAPGTLVLDERMITVVAMRTDAFIESVADVTTGDRVEKGEPLFQFFSKEIASVAAELANSNVFSEGAALRLRNLGLTPKIIAEIHKSRRVPDRIPFDAPASGVVLERLATAGMMAASGEKLFLIADTSKVWVVAEVSESQVEAVRKDAHAVISVRSLPDASFNGRVSLIYPALRPETRTAKVRIEIDNPHGKLLANMYADVQISSGKDAAVLAVPNTAVIDTGDRQIVFVDLGDGRFKPQDVKLGIRGAENTEITSGIKAGDRVVVAANFLLDAESNLTSALSAMSPPEETK